MDAADETGLIWKIFQFKMVASAASCIIKRFAVSKC
jgi:hypothetical protein